MKRETAGERNLGPSPADADAVLRFALLPEDKVVSDAGYRIVYIASPSITSLRLAPTNRWWQRTTRYQTLTHRSAAR